MSFDADLFNALMGGATLEHKAREEYVRAPFGWPGGKWHSLDYLCKHLPYRKVWVDACGGSGIVTLNRHPSPLEVFNDRHAGVVAFYRCIRDSEKSHALVARLKLTVHSREEFIWSRDSWANCSDEIERACRWYYSLRMSFSSLGRNFGRSTAGIPQQARAMANSLKLFPRFHERFREIQVENLDAVQCLRDFDSHDTVTYLDPDYQGTDPGIYKHSVDHLRMIETIKDSRGFVAVSGYANPLYDSQHFWDDRKEWDVMVSSKALAFTETNNLKGKENVMDRGKRATECLWIKESR